MADEKNESVAPDTSGEDTRTEEQKARDERTSKNTVTIEEAGPCKKKVIVEVPEETIKDMADEQYRELRRDAVVPGFRKGRAPRRLLEKRFGKETSEQIKLKILAEASEAAMKDKKVDALTDPDIDYENIKLPDSGPMRFEFEVEVRPEFELPALEGIPVTRTKLEVTDAQVDREIEQLRRWSGLWVPKEEGAVEQGDEVVADVRLNVHLTDEEKAKQAEAAAKGEEAPTVGIPESETKLDNSEIHVRPNGFVGAVPVPKLDELLTGAKAGDKKTTTVEVSKTYFREEYQGRTIDIEIDVKEVKYLKPAEMNEQFLQRYHVGNEQELRDRIRDNLQDQLESQVRSDMSEQVYQHLLDNASFDLPMDIVARQAGSILQRQYINLLARGLSREQIEEQMEQLRAASADQAKQQLKTFFIMDKVADKLEIAVTEEEINGHIAQVAIQRGQRPEKLKEQMERDGSLAQFRLDIRQNKCISKLLETANVSEQKSEEKARKSKKGNKSAEEKSEEQ
ncbi:MAG: trigger factor [Sedimentisphaerales bacterium]|nr:trigger factor [Sedimentisphaerales bacterium]